MPIFAMGRAQELVAMLHSLKAARHIPDMPLYLSGLAHAICRIYDATGGETPRGERNPRLGETGYKVIHPERLANPKLLARPSLLALTSGMMVHGTSSHLMTRAITAEPRNGVAFVGYVDPSTPGHALAEASQDQIIDMGGEVGPVRVACPVQRFQFTAHSRASQLVDTVKRLAPAHVVLVHGDDAAVETLAGRLAPLVPRVTVAEPRARIDI